MLFEKPANWGVQLQASAGVPTFVATEVGLEIQAGIWMENKRIDRLMQRKRLTRAILLVHTEDSKTDFGYKNI